MVTNSSMNASGFNGSFNEVPYNRCACCQHSAVCALKADYEKANTLMDGAEAAE